MRIRASQTLVFSRGDDNTLVGCNFLTRSVFECTPELFELLFKVANWVAADALSVDENEALPDLLELSAIVTEDSELARIEEEYQSAWRWSTPTAMLHFCLQDPTHMTPADIEAVQIARAERVPTPDLYLRNRGDDVIRLPRAGSELIDLMARRRTKRTAAVPSIRLNQLADCLFAGMGITGETTNCVGRLPLGMTPSGGARNPYEAYVIAPSVEGLAPAIYHYSAADHDLGRVMTNQMPRISELIGGQEWGDQMPCLIVLAARLERTMWKYEDDPNAYRVVLIEAGHIGQNIMLAATSHGLTACPTAALSHTKIREALGLTRITDAPIYALTLSVPTSTVVESAAH